MLDANTEDFTTVSIRPKFVWGAGSPVTAARRHRKGRADLVDRRGRHTTDITFVDNAVEGLLLGWQHGKPGQAYFITDQEPVQFREFMQTVSTSTASTPRSLTSTSTPRPGRSGACTLVHRADLHPAHRQGRQGPRLPAGFRTAALDILRRSRQPETTSADR